MNRSAPGQHGFQNTPVSKLIVFGTIGASVLAGLMKTSPRMLTIPELLAHPSRSWKLLVSPWTYYTASEILFGTLLLYMFRVFERHWGSRKFASFAFMSSLTSLLGHLALYIILHPTVWQHLRPGPYGLLFALMWRYAVEIPAVSKYSVFGITLSDKLPVYVLAGQLALSHPPTTITAGISGLFGGWVASAELLRLSRVQFPQSWGDWAYRYIVPLLQSNTRRFTITRPLPANIGNQDTVVPQQLMPNAANGLFGWNLRAARQDLQQRREQQAAARQPPPRRPAAAPEAMSEVDRVSQAFGAGLSASSSSLTTGPSLPGASEDEIAKLCELGFDRERSRQALELCGNNVELAVQYLVTELN